MERFARVFRVCKGFLLALLVIMVTFSGCSSRHAPLYVQERYPYREIVYQPYDSTAEAALRALKKMRFRVVSVADPLDYERSWQIERGEHQLILAERKSRNLLMSPVRERLNVYLRKGEDRLTTELEIRYSKSTLLGFRKIHNFRNDELVKKYIKAVQSDHSAAP